MMPDRRTESETRSVKRVEQQEKANANIATQNTILADQSTGTFRNSLFVKSGKRATCKLQYQPVLTWHQKLARPN